MPNAMVHNRLSAILHPQYALLAILSENSELSFAPPAATAAPTSAVGMSCFSLSIAPPIP